MHWSCYSLCQDRSLRTFYIVKQEAVKCKAALWQNKKSFLNSNEYDNHFLHLLHNLLKFLATNSPLIFILCYKWKTFNWVKRNRDCFFVEQLRKQKSWPSLILTFNISYVFQIEYPTHFLNLRIDHRKKCSSLHISIYKLITLAVRNQWNLFVSALKIS